MDLVTAPRPGFERLAALGAVTRQRVVDRITVRQRLQRVHDRWWLIAQCSIAAAAAWWIASDVFDKPTPFFAPAAAIISLGMSYGRRLRRTIEIIVGVAVGVGVGDAFVSVAGVGIWQIAVTVALALALAVFLSGAQLIVTQAGVQAVIVTTLIPSSTAGLSRWLDAVIGGGVALLFATVAPTSPLLRPREEAVEVVREIAAVLDDVVANVLAGDEEAAAETLERARRSEATLETLRHALDEALAVTKITPGRRRHAEVVRDVAAMVDPLDHAIRNMRVLARRVMVAQRYGERVPDGYLALVTGLAGASTSLADHLADRRPVVEVRELLVDVARASSAVDAVPSLSAQVVLAQTRSMVVDLLEATGLEYPDAVALVPPPRGLSL
jgi:uncharacterized membrane protein YgaE (UPF0421/DUF939 family)